MADSEDYVGIRSPYAATSETNATDYQIKQHLREVYTNFIGIVQDCDGKEENSGAGYVTVLPALQQTDGQNNALQAAPIYKSPYGRYQYGIAGFIVDPVAGDKVACCAPKNDSSGITADTTTAQAPASLSEFSQSNSISVMPILTKTPENWIVLRQDKTREGYAPEGITDRTDKDLVIDIGQNRTITIGSDDTITIGGSCRVNITGSCTITAASVTIDTPQTNITGNVTIAGTLSQGEGSGGAATFGGSVTAQGAITSNSDVTSNGISLTGHVHGGVRTGDGTTSGPQ